MGYTVREVSNNSYVVAGGTDFYYNWHWFTSSPIVNTNIHLFKVDLNGVLQWERVISQPGKRMIARWMEPTFDGGYILTGSSNNDKVWPPDSNDVVLVKADGSGMISWAKNFDTGKDDLGFCVQQTADSGYIISGFHDAIPLSLAFTTYILLIKTDANGNIQWEKKYQFAVRDFNTHEPFSYVVKQVSNGGYVITGTNAVVHPADAEVLCVDALGNVLWAKTYAHDASVWRNSLGIDVIETSSGDFVIAGSMDKDSPLHLNYPYFLKIDNAGNVLKERFYETLPVLNFQSGFSSVQQTIDGGFFFTGMGGYSDFGDQAQLLKTDANLEMQWSRVYTVDGTATVGSMSGRQTSDGGYVFTGKRQMTGSMLMKTDAAGFVPCKNPNSLIEYIPVVVVQNWIPAVISGISVNNSFLTVTSPMTDTSIICPIINTHLPVELIYFSASPLESKKVQVKWITASETNSDYFSIEKSTDGKLFTEAGKRNGAGNSSVTINYFFIDEQGTPCATTYYRLRQVDFDGTDHYSKTIAVKSDNLSCEITHIYADYESHCIKIVVDAGDCESALLTLMDGPGKIIISRPQQLNKGISTLVFDMAVFSSGIYLATIITDKTVLCRKVIY